MTRARAALLLLAALLILRIALTYHEFNATVDEYGHIASSLEPYQFGAYTLDQEHPPLGRLAIGLLPYLWGARLAAGHDRYALAHQLLGAPGRYWEFLALSRLGTLLFLPVLVYFVYRWSALLYGRGAGLAAVAVASFCPNLIAHASLATLDLAAAATILAAAFYLWQWAVEPGLAACLRAALATGVALLTKFSAWIYLPPLFVAFWLLARLTRRTAWSLAGWRAALGQTALFGGLLCLLLWAGYFFDTRPIADPALRPYETIDRFLAPGSAPSRAAYRLAEAIFFPPRELRAGIRIIHLHAQVGHPAYLLGATSASGWWYYFLVVLAVKTTLPMLLLVLFAGALLLADRGRDPARRSIAVVLAVAVSLGVAMASPINIGVRHILPVYLFLAILSSAVFAPSTWSGARRRLVTAAGVLLLLWHGAESALAHPDYLAYFNPIARGTEAHYLLDSNLDWGQDLARLARYLDQRGIREVHLSFFGDTSPAVMGIIKVYDFGPLDRPRGWVAISVSLVRGHGVIPPHGYSWLKAYQPHARIGKSILLYHLP